MNTISLFRRGTLLCRRLRRCPKATETPQAKVSAVAVVTVRKMSITKPLRTK